METGEAKLLARSNVALQKSSLPTALFSIRMAWPLQLNVFLHFSLVPPTPLFSLTRTDQTKLESCLHLVGEMVKCLIAIYSLSERHQTEEKDCASRITAEAEWVTLELPCVWKKVLLVKELELIILATSKCPFTCLFSDYRMWKGRWSFPEEKLGKTFWGPWELLDVILESPILAFSSWL